VLYARSTEISERRPLRPITLGLAF